MVINLTIIETIIVDWWLMINPGGANDVGVLGVIFQILSPPGLSCYLGLSRFQIRPVGSTNLSGGHSEPHPYIMGSLEVQVYLC